MKKYLQVLFLILIGTVDASSQLEYSNWYFGNYTGVTFNTSDNEPVSILGNTISQFEGVATISSATGNVVLYTNGEFVFNRTGGILNLESPLYGHQSSTQSAILFPHPGKSGQYYLFTADAGEYTGQTNRGINYSIVDINANSGFGGFVEFNVPLLPTASEQLSATFHANGKDVWVVARGWKNNNFYAYLVTANGIADTVVTSIGFTRTKEFNSIGCLRFSPNGGMAALPAYDEEFVELFRFDNKSGVFYNRLQVNISDHFTLYGAEFSSNGKVLYISSSKNPFGFYSIFQFNVSNYNKNAIENSMIKIAHDEGHIGTMQRGPNNKIYIAPLNVPYLYSIENPNNLGSNARFMERRISLQDSVSQLGLPQSFMVPPNFRSFAVCEGSDVILDTDDFLYDTIRYESSYFWNGPNGFQSFAPRPVISDITLADSGLYVLTAIYKIDESELTTTYKINIRVGEHVNFKITGNDTICKGRFTVLACDTANSSFTYLWSNNSRTPTIMATQPGLYKLFIRTEYGCLDSAEFRLTVLDAPVAEILGSKLLCEKKSVTLSSAEISGEYNYLWSTGETTPEITVNNPGNYKLIISNMNGCKDSATVKVVSYPELNVRIVGDTIWCKEGLAKLEALVTPYDSTLTYSYLWSNGEVTPIIYVNKTATYSVKVVIENKCSYTDSVTVKKSDPPKLVVNIPEYIEICEGDSFTANILERDTSMIYYWSDGVKDFPRVIDISGTYKIIVSNDIGCTEEFEFNVLVLEKPVAEIIILDESNICNADSLILDAYPKGHEYRYKWLNNGSSDEQLVIKISGVYYLVVFKEGGCSDTTSINIELGKGLPMRISGRTSTCSGDTLLLTANVNFTGDQSKLTYLWTTGETTKSIFVTEGGQFKVVVKHTSGCEGKDSVVTRFYDVPNIILNYTEPKTICRGDDIIVMPDSIHTGWIYYWNDGSYQVPRSFNQAGKYTLYAVNAGICMDSAVFELIVTDKPLAKISLDSDTRICENESVILSTDEYLDENSYLWSDGSSNQFLEASNPGWYVLTVVNSFGCKAIDSILIVRAETPELFLSAQKPYLCTKDSVTINATGNFADIFWEDGSSERELTVNKEGFVSAYARSEDGCLIHDSIFIQLFSVPISVSADNFDFGVLCPGLTEQKTSVLKNLSDYDIEIISITEIGNDEFKLMSNLLNSIILAGGNKDILASFSPTAHGEFSKRVKIVYKHVCLDSLEFELSGTSSFSSTITLPDVKATSGEDLCFSVSYKFGCIEDVDFVSNALLQISFDAQYFLPKSVSFGTIIRNEVKNGIRYLDIKLENIRMSDITGSLVIICGTALIGDDTLTSLILENFEWSEKINVQKFNGSIINEACAIDIRNIQYFTPTSINITPNPVTDFMNVSVISQEKGTFVLELVNYEGRTILKDIWKRDKDDSEVKIFNISTNELPSGIYMFKLSSPWHVENSKVIIVK